MDDDRDTLTPAQLLSGLRYTAKHHWAVSQVTLLTQLDQQAARQVVADAIKVAVYYGAPIWAPLDQVLQELSAGYPPCKALERTRAREEAIRSLWDTARVDREQAVELLREVLRAYPPPPPGPTAVHLAALFGHTSDTRAGTTEDVAGCNTIGDD